MESKVDKFVDPSTGNSPMVLPKYAPTKKQEALLYKWGADSPATGGVSLEEVKQTETPAEQAANFFIAQFNKPYSELKLLIDSLNPTDAPEISEFGKKLSESLAQFVSADSKKDFNNRKEEFKKFCLEEIPKVRPFVAKLKDKGFESFGKSLTNLLNKIVAFFMSPFTYCCGKKAPTFFSNKTSAETKLDNFENAVNTFMPDIS